MVGRPRLFDESSAMEAAMLLFWRQGFEATSLAQLRDATGLSSASLYNAFGSKEGLFEKVIDHYVSRPGSVASLVGASQDLDGAQALSQLLHRTVDEQLDDSHPSGCLIALSATVGPGPEGGPASRVVARQRIQDRHDIDSLVRRAAEEGALDSAHGADAVATVVHTFILGLATQAHDGMNADTLHDAVDAMSTLWTPR